MRDDLISLYGAYPEILLRVNGIRPQQIEPALMTSLKAHRQHQLALLEAARVFRLDEDTEWMLSRLVIEMNDDGLEDSFHKVRLPFPQIFLERGAATRDGSKRAAILSQLQPGLAVQSFATTPQGAFPSLIVMEAAGVTATYGTTPTLELVKAMGGKGDIDRALDEELTVNRHFLGVAAGLSILLQHEGMLEVEEVPAQSRAERRRAARSGRPLPESRIVRIRLGQAGRGQVAAMRGDGKPEDGQSVPRRAHWVRGHMMRNRSGGTSWRMPHIRGAGPVIGQEWHIGGDQRHAGDAGEASA